MAFERWTTWYGQSRSYRRFKAHHTEINEIYWSLAPVGSCARFLSRKASDTDSPASVFHAAGPHARRLAPTMASWRGDFREFENWVRLSMLMSALSYFEAYTSTIVTIALRSDPLVRYGDSRAFDGVRWLKKNTGDDLSEYLRPCVIGEWSKRLSGYRKLFGEVPNELAELEGTLERMRIFRNGTAHSFGRSPTYFEHPSAPAGASERLSENSLLEYLGTIETAAAAIDDHLAPKHIGEFELLMAYHSWRALPRAEKEPNFAEAAGFSRHISRLYGQAPGRAFFKQLINFYNSVA